MRRQRAGCAWEVPSPVLSITHRHMHRHTHAQKHAHTHTYSLPGRQQCQGILGSIVRSLPLPSRRLALPGDLKAWAVDTQWHQNHKKTGQVLFPHKSVHYTNEQGNVQVEQMVVLLELKHGILWSYQHRVWNNNLIKAYNRKIRHQ